MFQDYTVAYTNIKVEDNEKWFYSINGIQLFSKIKYKMVPKNFSRLQNNLEIILYSDLNDVKETVGTLHNMFTSSVQQPCK